MSKRVRVATVARIDVMLPVNLMRVIMGFETFPETAVRLLVSRKWRRDRENHPRYPAMFRLHIAKLVEAEVRGSYSSYVRRPTEH